MVVPSLYLQVEGVETVLDAVAQATATAICLEPGIAAVSGAVAGAARFPDVHVDGLQRVLDRPLLGERELYLRRFSAYEPDPACYDRGGYRPRSRPGPAESVPRPNVFAETLVAAAARGLEVHVQLSPLSPPGLRPDDLSVRVDGTSLDGVRVSNTGCVNSPSLELYGRGLVRDLVARHDAVHAVMLDWVEFPAYSLSEGFACFCPHCETAARALGVDWEQVRRDVGRLWGAAHDLDSSRLGRFRRALGRPSALVELLADHPGVLEFVRFKAACVARFYGAMAETLCDLDGGRVTLSARGWAPPWNSVSGMSYRSAAAVCETVAPKLFSFDYAALPRWYGETLRDWSPRLPEEDIVELFLTLFDLVRLPGKEKLGAYLIPRPDEPHPIDAAGIERRVTEIIDQVGGRALVRPIAHAYGPVDQWERTVSTLRNLPVDGIWVQMYGYLSDEKVAVLERTWG